MEERQEAAIIGRRGRHSESECALTYMNAGSGQNLSDVLTTPLNVARTERGIARRTRQRHGHARFLRTDVTFVWGVSDPLQLDHGAKKGGWQVGSLTPRCLHHCC